MAVKKGILDNFLKPSSHYSDNQKSLRSIFIDKNEDDLKPDPKNFLEASVVASELLVDDMQSSATTNSVDIEIVRKEVIKKLDTNLTQTQHKSDTNLTQELNTNSTQSEHGKVITNAYQTQTQHKLDTKLNTQKTQSRHKVDTK